MCDYSLMGIRNRLAVEGEELVTSRFSTGSVGLAPWHKGREQIQTRAHPGFWTVLWKVVWGPVGDPEPKRSTPAGAGHRRRPEVAAPRMPERAAAPRLKPDPAC
jgi:hypothetical protein